MTGLWFLPARPLRLNTNEWMNELLLLLITLNDTSSLSMTALDNGSVRRKYVYLYSTQHSQWTDKPYRGGIQTRSLSKRAALDRAATGIGHSKIYCGVNLVV